MGRPSGAANRSHVLRRFRAFLRAKEIPARRRGSAEQYRDKSPGGNMTETKGWKVRPVDLRRIAAKTSEPELYSPNSN
jgi:hypothetical protein